MNVVALELLPDSAAAPSSCRLGVNCERSSVESMLRRSSAGPVNAVTATGALWSPSSRRRALTTISSDSAAPLSTIDRATADGAAIPIEERRAEEVTEVFGTRIAPRDTEAVNFAFDVTPHDLITAIVTEAGVLEPPFTRSIAAAFGGA